jgi:hypothetical protein
MVTVFPLAVAMVNVNLLWMTGRRAQWGYYVRARIRRGVTGPRIGIRSDGWGTVGRTSGRARRRADMTVECCYAEIVKVVNIIRPYPRGGPGGEP